MPKSLVGFLEALNLKENVDTYHIGFMIGPRINAGGRIESPYDSLRILLCETADQMQYIEKIENINDIKIRKESINNGST